MVPTHGDDGLKDLPLHWSLLFDGAMDFFAEAELAGLAERWAPQFRDRRPVAGDRSRTPTARIDLRLASAHTLPCSTLPSTFRLAEVSACVDDAMGIVYLHGADRRSRGVVELSSLWADLRAAPNNQAIEGAEMDIFTMLTISAALLLGRMERALVHAAAIEDAEGGAWLLIGDTHAGKTTTTLNLIRAGHRYLSDDHVVLSTEPTTGRVSVEGWPRTFHVDEGWERSEVSGRRKDLEPAALGAGRWTRTAPLAGILFPRLDGQAATRVEPLAPAAALALLVRQSPWFMADAVAAPRILALLSAVAALPAFHLVLGRDSYSDHHKLSACLDPVFAGGSNRGDPEPTRRQS